MVKAVVLSNPKELESILSLAPSALNNLKLTLLKSERKGLDKIEKSRWCSGGAVVLEAWTASSFTLVSEWKKPIR